MITKYMMVQADKLSALAERVNNQIKKGWQPLGAPFQWIEYDDGSGYRFAQAMTSDTQEEQ